MTDNNVRMNARAQFTASGYPSLEELAAAQGTAPIAEVSVLHGSFWPEEETMECVVETLREWRRHRRTDPTA